MTNTNGFYWLESRSGSRVLCQSCTNCHSFTKCSPDEPARAFCCGVWKVPPKETFFFNLPTEKYKETRVRMLHDAQTSL